MELKRRRVIARCWKRKDLRRSLDLVLILRPRAEMREMADEFRVPKFSKAMGWKLLLLLLLLLLNVFVNAPYVGV